VIPRDRERALHALLDGSATPAEREQTEAWLAGSPEGRQRRAELDALFAALGSLPRESAPEGLRDDVMEAIRGRGVSRSARPAQAAWSRPRWALLAPLAVAVVAVIAFPWWRHALGPDALREVSGSISGAAADGVTSRWHVGDATVSVRVFRDDASAFAEFDVSGGGTVEIELVGAGGSLADPDVRGGRGRVQVVGAGRGSVVLRAVAGARFALAIPAAGEDHPVRISLRSGAHRAGGVLPVPPGRGGS